MPKGFDLTAEEKTARQTYIHNNCIFLAPNNIVMCGRGFALTMIGAEEFFMPTIRKASTKAFSRHFEWFFNTHACMAGLIAGLVVALEKKKLKKRHEWKAGRFTTSSFADGAAGRDRRFVLL